MSGARTIVITADDFGWTDGQNLAVWRAAQAGTLHRASLLANGAAFPEAVEMAQRLPRLGVGVHLTLCEGRPLLSPRRLGPLCRRDGQFFDRLAPIVKLYLSGRLDVEAVTAEWQSQIEQALAALGPGRRLSHLDGHKHIHLLPPLFDVALLLCRRYGVPYLRIPAESFEKGMLSRAPAWALLSGLALRARQRLRAFGDIATSDSFVGFAQSGAMTTDRLLRAILACRPGVTEIMMHPAAETAGLLSLHAKYAWARRYQFTQELAALCDPRVAAALRACTE